MLPPRPLQAGAPPKTRPALARAYLAKAWLRYGDTKAFRARVLADPALRRVCGWATATAVPSAATFSRAFAAFAEWEVADATHAQRVKDWLGDILVWHQATDVAVKLKMYQFRRLKNVRPFVCLS